MERNCGKGTLSDRSVAQQRVSVRENYNAAFEQLNVAHQQALATYLEKQIIFRTEQRLKTQSIVCMRQNFVQRIFPYELFGEIA